MRIKSVFLLLIVVTGVAAVAAQERFVRFVDEANMDPSFASFRAKLISAAERHDAAYIVSTLDPKILINFGGASGIAAFKKEWKPQAKGSKFWAEFLAVIRNGGAFDQENGKRKNSFWAPYTFHGFPDGLDPLDYRVVFGTDVNMRKEPRTSSESIAKLSYNIVYIEPELVPKSGMTEYPGWYLVKTFGGLEGYIKSAFVRSSTDFRAGFEKKRGKWVVTAFVNGD
jgi:hypothetical protein